MFQTKVVEKIKTHFVFNIVFSESHTVYLIVWQARDDSIILRRRFACWITKTTDTYS